MRYAADTMCRVGDPVSLVDFSARCRFPYNARCAAWGSSRKSLRCAKNVCGQQRFSPHYSVRRDKVPFLSGANPARQLSLQPVAVGADDGGNDIG